MFSQTVLQYLLLVSNGIVACKKKLLMILPLDLRSGPVYNYLYQGGKVTGRRTQASREPIHKQDNEMDTK